MPFSYAILPQLIVWKLEAMADARGSKFTLTERYCDYAQRVSRVWLPDTCGRAAAASARDRFHGVWQQVIRKRTSGHADERSRALRLEWASEKWQCRYYY